MFHIFKKKCFSFESQLKMKKKFHHTSSSLSNMLGIPDVMGNFLPVSGHTSSPFITSTCYNKTIYKYIPANIHIQQVLQHLYLNKIVHIRPCWIRNMIRIARENVSLPKLKPFTIALLCWQAKQQLHKGIYIYIFSNWMCFQLGQCTIFCLAIRHVTLQFINNFSGKRETSNETLINILDNFTYKS